MVADISAVTRAEVLGALRSRYREASRKVKSRMLDEFVAIAGCHRKHTVSVIRQGSGPFPKASVSTMRWPDKR